MTSSTRSVAHPAASCQPKTRAPHALQPALPLWDPRIEPIPGVPRAYCAESETEPGTRYTTNLTTMACSCADSTYNWQDLPIDHPYRACKHCLSAADLEDTLADARAWERQQHADADQPVPSLTAPTTLICASCGHETYAIVDDGICAACSFFDDGGRPFRQVAEDARGTEVPPPASPLSFVRHCPTCEQPSADGYIYCTVSRATRRAYCGARAGDLMEAFGG